MIREERLLKVLRAPHVSEKATMSAENDNTLVFKVAIDATKAEIKQAVEKLLEVEVKSVRTLITKGKTKRQGMRMGRRNDLKKAYVSLKDGQDINEIDFADSAE